MKIKIPYFILGFLRAILANTFVPAICPVGPLLVSATKIGLTVTLFFQRGVVGQVVKTVEAKPYVLGLLLWVVISTVSLYIILRVGQWVSVIKY